MASFSGAAAATGRPAREVAGAVASTKGERALAALAPSQRPRPRHPPPTALLREDTLRYDPAAYDLVGAMRTLLELPEGVPLERYAPQGDTWSMAARRKLQARLRACGALCDAYERLIRDVVAPSLARYAPPDTADADAREGGNANASGGSGSSRRKDPHSSDGGAVTVLYQFPPTLRVHAARSKQFRRAHRDAEFGHQPVS